MKIVLFYLGLFTGARGFIPARQPGTLPTARSMSLVDDWTKFFSPGEARHRREELEKEMEEMMAAQKEILERRRDPQMMEVYHQREVARHERLDRQHDVDIENEVALEWTPDEHPLTGSPYERKGHSMLDDWKKFFSKGEMDRRSVQQHLGQMDTADAEQEMLQRRRDPAKMKAYHEKEEARHELFDRRHEVEEGFEYAEEKVLEEGQEFLGGLLKGMFGKNKQSSK